MYLELAANLLEWNSNLLGPALTKKLKNMDAYRVKVFGFSTFMERNKGRRSIGHLKKTPTAWKWRKQLK
jgi:hypothetical protein